MHVHIMEYGLTATHPMQALREMDFSRNSLFSQPGKVFGLMVNAEFLSGLEYSSSLTTNVSE